ncbi:MFS transporter, partial [bacterium]|nr:MFS transporter [bacterium]
SIQQIGIVLGLFFAFLSNYLIVLMSGGSTQMFALGYEAWRWMFWIELAPAFLFLFALFIIPESPRFLVASGKNDKALQVLGRLMGEGGQKKLSEIQSSLAGNKHRPRLSDILDSKRGIRPIVWVGVWLAAFSQLVGINVVFYYGAVLWQAAGFSEDNALLINVVTGGVSIGACLVATLLVDRIGRKPLLLVGSFGMALTLGAMAFVFATGALGENGALKLGDDAGLIALIAANLYVIFFNATWGPVMWVMLGEMFPNQIRGSGLAVSGLSVWVTNFGITMLFPVMLTSIGLGGAYGIYAFFALISAFFVIKFTRETKGLELEDMEG